MAIFLVRHGQDTDNANKILNGRRDTDLTELGKKQARIVAQKLKNNQIQAIYSSPLRRAYETAKIIAEELGINKVVIDQRLIERDFGVLTGKKVDDIQKYADKILVADRINYFLEAEGAETFPILYERGKKIIREIQERHPESNILVVTHGDIGKMMRAAYYELSWEDGLKITYFDNAGILELQDSARKVHHRLNPHKFTGNHI